VIKLFSVIEWLTKGRDKLSVPMQVPTHKKVGVAFAKTNLGVCDAVNSVLHTLHDNGEFARLVARWLPPPSPITR
jgi:ABC-type amino acid transport substrate-binding protein